MAACTDGDGDIARPGLESTAPQATATFETLPPVGTFTYPRDPDVVIAQITVDGTDLPLPLPLLTIYGDGRTITIDGDRWVQGNLTDIEVQEFLGGAAGAGLLDEPLDLRGPLGGNRPDISVLFVVDGNELRHELDLSEIERPVALRSFLVQSSSFNVFALSEPFEPEAWLTCSDGSCASSAERVSDVDRPVLPHETTDPPLLPQVFVEPPPSVTTDGGS